MTFNEYQSQALRTSGQTEREKLLLNGVMGLCGEAGECIDLMKKHLFQGHALDTQKLLDEAGDCLWYLAALASGMGLELSAIAEHNIEKLRKRYPDGFDSQKSIHREECAL